MEENSILRLLSCCADAAALACSVSAALAAAAHTTLHIRALVTSQAVLVPRASEEAHPGVLAPQPKGAAECRGRAAEAEPDAAPAGVTGAPVSRQLWPLQHLLFVHAHSGMYQGLLVLHHGCIMV